MPYEHIIEKTTAHELQHHLKITVADAHFYSDYDKKCFWNAVKSSHMPIAIHEDNSKLDIFTYEVPVRLGDYWGSYFELKRLCLIFIEFGMSIPLLQLYKNDPVSKTWVDITDDLEDLVVLYDEPFPSYALNRDFSFIKRHTSALRKHQKIVVKGGPILLFHYDQSFRVQKWLRSLRSVVQLSADYHGIKIFIHRNAMTLEDMTELAAFFCRYDMGRKPLDRMITALPRNVQSAYQKVINDIWSKKYYRFVFDEE